MVEEVVWCETGVLHSPQVGKTSGLGLFLQWMLLQFPVSETRRGVYCSDRAFFQPYLYVGGWYNQMGIDALDQPRIYLGMTEVSRKADRSCFNYFSMRNFCQDVIKMMEWNHIIRPFLVYRTWGDLFVGWNIWPWEGLQPWEKAWHLPKGKCRQGRWVWLEVVVRVYMLHTTVTSHRPGVQIDRAHPLRLGMSN